MILPPEAWMDLGRCKPLRDAGAMWKEIAAELGLDPRTVKKYINGPATPPAAPRGIGHQPRLTRHPAPGGRPSAAADRAPGTGGRRLVDHRHHVAGLGDP